MPRSDRMVSAAAIWRMALLCSAVTCAFAPAARAESVPASVRACTLETDSLKRLICFDREVARYTDQPSSGGGKQGPAGSPLAHERSEPTAPTVPPTLAREDRSDSGQPAAAASPPTAPRRISARIVSIENFPDAIVVHLDNEQVWQQIQEASADVNLHAGDSVTIDREMGAFWMSGSSGVAMKVRRKK
jgi:hypothetical protein